MKEKIAVTTVFSNFSIDSINSILSLNEPLCKIPYGRNISNRYEVDSMPYHITLSSCDIKQKDFVINELSKIDLKKFKLTIDKVDVMKGKENSYVLYFNVLINNAFKELLEKIYSIIESDKYKIDVITPHITITIDKDYNKIIEIKNRIDNNFRSFEVEVIGFYLWELWPPVLIQEFI